MFKWGQRQGAGDVKGLGRTGKGEFMRSEDMKKPLGKLLFCKLILKQNLEKENFEPTLHGWIILLPEARDYSS